LFLKDGVLFLQPGGGLFILLLAAAFLIDSSSQTEFEDGRLFSNESLRAGKGVAIIIGPLNKLIYIF
jgi:hypothetical protein